MASVSGTTRVRLLGWALAVGILGTGSLGSPLRAAAPPQVPDGSPPSSASDSQQQVSDGPVRSVWDGIYTEDQADLGERLYQQECANCHDATLMGGETGPALAGDLFLTPWYGSTVADLFDRIRETMPADSPGRLSRQQYADVLSHILRENNFPIGQIRLEAATGLLKQVRLERNPSGDR